MPLDPVDSPVQRFAAEGSRPALTGLPGKSSFRGQVVHHSPLMARPRLASTKVS